MVEVFKTNIIKKNEAKTISKLLKEHFPDCRVDFDLEDTDKILRIESKDNIKDNVRELIQLKGYYCEGLE